MERIRELLQRDLTQRIEEIVKVDQADEQSVYGEITEYIATDRIRDQYRDLLRAIAEVPADPHEGIGVWISGFFGSGKSSFAKILGYLLANRPVLGQRAADLFKAQVKDERISALIDSINARIPTEVVMFDVQVDRAVRRSTERIAEVMYTVLLRELGYAEDYDVAELEIELEGEGKLESFVQRCRQEYGIPWETVRMGAQKIARASALLHHLDPKTYPAPETWSRSLGEKRADITVGRFVERAFELCARRRPGKALTFIIDEVGQYVARSADKIEDLRAVVEQFGLESKNRVKAGKAIAPVWVVVTSQEKLDEVVAAIDSKRVELAKLQDRFKYRIDLSPADIREVATRRVLAKKEAAVPLLQRLYRDSQGLLNIALRLERTTRSSAISEEEFIQFYPYPPHFIELSIDIVSGIRLQPGAPRHVGGSNRTIIKQAYEMLVSDRTALAERSIGTLVTLDRIFDLVEGNLSEEKRRDLHDVRQRFHQHADDHGMAVRVTKALALLEFVRDLPRTEANLAAVLVEAVGAAPPLAEVCAALDRLQRAQFVRETDEGWKLLTAQEKSWDTERSSFLEPTPRDRNEILREALKEIFAEPSLKTYHYRSLRHFRVGVRVDGAPIGDDGQLPLSVVTADDDKTLPERIDLARGESREKSHENELFWIFALTPTIDDLVANLHASRQMIARYEQERARGKISTDQAASLEDEKGEAARLTSRLREALLKALETGTGLFRGVSKDGASLGASAPEVFRAFFDLAVPDLYPKLEMGARSLTGDEAEDLLKAADLSGLPPVFYDGPTGLNLVLKQDGHWVVNPEAAVAREVMQYLSGQHAYGNKDTRTGKALEARFGGLTYGWDRDMLRLILAALFRAGSIDVSSGGQRFDSFHDPRSRVPLVNNTAFRSALFTPVTPIELKTLTKAVRSYEDLTGDTVDVDKNAIARAFRKLAEEELKALLPVEAEARANALPVDGALRDYRQTLEAALDGGAEDCVRALAGEGRSLKTAREEVRKIRHAAAPAGLQTFRQARAAVGLWPALEARGENGPLAASAAALADLLASETFYDSLSELGIHAAALAARYCQLYTARHTDRAARFDAAIEQVKGRPEWPSLSDAMQAPTLLPLTTRACSTLDLSDGAASCARCDASLGQLDSDLAALPGLTAQVIARLQELAAPEEKSERVRLADFFTTALDSEYAIDQALAGLREHLLKLHAEGIRIIAA